MDHEVITTMQMYTSENIGKNYRYITLLTSYQTFLLQLPTQKKIFQPIDHEELKKQEIIFKRTQEQILADLERQAFDYDAHAIIGLKIETQSLNHEVSMMIGYGVAIKFENEIQISEISRVISTHKEKVDDELPTLHAQNKHHTYFFEEDGEEIKNWDNSFLLPDHLIEKQTTIMQKHQKNKNNPE